MASILLVDDDPKQLELFHLLLRHLPYTLLDAQSGPEALEVLENETPEAIVLDLAMPRMSGTDFLFKVRENPRFKATRIIVLTAVPERLGKGGMEMIDRLIAKTFVVPKLEQTLIELLSAPH
jgi:CheY-like chemotaxis protein